MLQQIGMQQQQILHRQEVEATLREQDSLRLLKIEQQQIEDATLREEQQANLLQIQQQLQQGNGKANAGNNAHDMEESQQDNVLNEDDASHVTSLLKFMADKLTSNKLQYHDEWQKESTTGISVVVDAWVKETWPEYDEDERTRWVNDQWRSNKRMTSETPKIIKTAKTKWKLCKTALKTTIRDCMDAIRDERQKNVDWNRKYKEWNLEYFFGDSKAAKDDQRRLVKTVTTKGPSMQVFCYVQEPEAHENKRQKSEVPFFAPAQGTDAHNWRITATPSWTRLLRAFCYWYFEGQNSESSTFQSSRCGKNEKVPHKRHLSAEYLPACSTVWRADSGFFPPTQFDTDLADFLNNWPPTEA